MGVVVGVPGWFGLAVLGYAGLGVVFGGQVLVRCCFLVMVRSGCVRGQGHCKWVLG